MQTVDKAADVLVTEQVGRNRYWTPERYLYCEGVRIASTKPLLYRDEEMKKVRAKHGMVLMERAPEVLFSEDTIASFNGKSVTNSHPPTLLDPKTWNSKTVGTVLNPRRGDGEDAGYLLADLIISQEKAIKDVQDGKVEVSCGYDQDHEEIAPGHGRFTKITGNHVALVEKGRCGPQCAIKDEDVTMANMIDRLRNAFKDKDEGAFDTEIKGVEKALKNDEQRVVIELPGHTTNDANATTTALDKVLMALDAISDRLTKIETKDEESKKKEEKEEEEEKKTEDEEKEEEEKKKKAMEDNEHCNEGEKKEGVKEVAASKDAALDAMSLSTLRLEFQDVVAKAEVLSPGIKVPTFDATSNSKKTIADQMCGLRKASMQKAMDDAKRNAFVSKVTGANPDFEAMDCNTLTMAFNAATELARVANNAPRVSMDHMLFPSGPMTAEKLQKLNETRRRKTA